MCGLHLCPSSEPRRDSRLTQDVIITTIIDVVFFLNLD